MLTSYILDKYSHIEAINATHPDGNTLLTAAYAFILDVIASEAENKPTYADLGVDLDGSGFDDVTGSLTVKVDNTGEKQSIGLFSGVDENDNIIGPFRDIYRIAELTLNKDDVTNSIYQELPGINIDGSMCYIKDTISADVNLSYSIVGSPSWGPVTITNTSYASPTSVTPNITFMGFSLSSTQHHPDEKIVPIITTTPPIFGNSSLTLKIDNMNMLPNGLYGFFVDDGLHTTGIMNYSISYTTHSLGWFGSITVPSGFNTSWDTNIDYDGHNENEATDTHSGTVPTNNVIKFEITNSETYTINLIDLYGDGWNGATMTITNSNDSSVLFQGENTSCAHDVAQVFSRVFTPGTYNITVTLGDYSSEISWNIKNPSGTVVVTGDAPYNENFEVTDFSFKLISTPDINPPNSYTITLIDSYGDGWNGATMTITNKNDGSVLFQGENISCAAEVQVFSRVFTPGTTYNIIVTLGDYSKEISWNIKNPSGLELRSGGAPYNEDFPVP